MSDRNSLLVVPDVHIGTGYIYEEVEGVPSSAPVRPGQYDQPPKIKTKIPNPMDDGLFVRIGDNEVYDLGQRNPCQLRKGDK